MSKATLNRQENREQGLSVLRERLGVQGFIQFMQDFGLNVGNHTEEREQLFAGKSIDDLIKEAKQA